MQRHAVISTNLAAVGYDARRQILEVEFVNGTIYRYFKVPAEVYRRLLTTDSVGQYFDQQVKQAGYQYTRIGAAT